MYRRGLTLVDEQTKQRRDPQVVFTEAEMAEFVRRSAEANRGNRGGALRFTCDKDDEEVRRVRGRVNPANPTGACKHAELRRVRWPYFCDFRVPDVRQMSVLRVFEVRQSLFSGCAT